ncbi:MAG: hypothetical protein HY226_04955 [Candidatus Vogelbacteria bacterium]|nr:hypothetical protein [Candidatus Vogelbacteria bacterium]
MRKALKRFLNFFGAALVLPAIFWFGVNIDLMMNGGWLKTVGSQFQWYNYFTTYHALTIMYMNGQLDIAFCLYAAVATIIGLFYVVADKI